MTGARWRLGGLVAALALAGSPAPVWGQRPLPGDRAGRAFDLERRGQPAQAMAIYREMLGEQPADVGALLGLERTLGTLNRLADMVPDVQKALAVGEPSSALYGIAVRVYTGVRQPSDSVRAIVDRWAKLEPKSDAPYQEWGAAAMTNRDRATAKAAYQLGRQRLGGDVLAGELAQLATIDGDYDTAVHEWMGAIAQVPGYRGAAASMLGQIPAPARPGVLRALEQQRSPAAERLGATLAIRWGDPVGGIRKLERALPVLGPETVEALQDALDELRLQRGDDADLARGIGLELLGQKVPEQATRYWLEAARAYADAGDQRSARRMLGQLAGHPGASPKLAASATSTLVSVLVSEGKLDEANQQFEKLKGGLTEEDRQDLARRLTEGWMRQGQLDRALGLVANDSTVEGLALRGWIRLYQGRLGEAAQLLRDAGPYAGERAAAVSRTAVLALLQVIDQDSLPALGHALHGLVRHDSAGAADELERVGAGLPPERGGAEVKLLAGRVRAGLGQQQRAERIFAEVAALGIPASAPEAELERARILVAVERQSEAVALLEHLIVSYPASAVAPQARRLLDVVRGAVPPS